MFLLGFSEMYALKSSLSYVISLKICTNFFDGIVMTFHLTEKSREHEV